MKQPAWVQINDGLARELLRALERFPTLLGDAWDRLEEQGAVDAWGGAEWRRYITELTTRFAGADYAEALIRDCLAKK